MGSGVACCCSVLSLYFSCLCVRFFSVSLFLVLCALVSVKALFGRIKIVSVTAFFLMKNVLMHGREKNTFWSFIFANRIRDTMYEA